jgi:DNA gyrase subunit B
MRKTLTDLGLDGTHLIVRDDEGKEKRRLGGEEMRRVVDLLGRLDELVRVIQRRGIDFGEFLARRDAAGRLPLYQLVVGGEEMFFHTTQDRDQYLIDQNLALEVDESQESTAGTPTAGVPAAGTPTAGVPTAGVPTAGAEEHGRRLQKNQELHEVKDLEKLFAQLSQYDLSIDDYFLTQEESVSGEKLLTKYALLNDDKFHDVAGIAQMLPAILNLGKLGIEIKRFKGLGEMNSEQLWETTLDPARRVLLRVTLEEAGEAERLFSVLMGEDVERRRQFIEEHALEVKNLDV